LLGPVDIIASKRIPKENLKVRNNFAWGLMKVYPKLKKGEIKRILEAPELLGTV
jgi:hypothetical protein